MKFREKSIKDRQKQLIDDNGIVDSALLFTKDKYLEIANTMIENAVGFLPLPMGVVQNLCVNGKTYPYLPLCTEEPSIIAGLCKTIKMVENLSANTSPSFLSKGSIYLKANAKDFGTKDFDIILQNNHQTIKTMLDENMVSMTKRGGGYRYFLAKKLQIEDENIVCVDFYFDMCDSMGANAINRALEYIVPVVENLLNCEKVMAILSNDYDEKLTFCEFCIQKSKLSQMANGKYYDGNKVASDIILAQKICNADKSRKVTHNKGILNGIIALALALGQDTRAISSSIMSYPQPLTQYWTQGDMFCGKITLPSGFATTSHTISFHPAFKQNMQMIGVKDVKELSGVFASVGLLQNLTALTALVCGGIQTGHIKLHNKKL